MGKPTGFKEFPRETVPYRAPAERRATFSRSSPNPSSCSCARRARAAWTAACRFARATAGCPIDNLIPEWNDLVYQGRWQECARSAAQDQQLPRVHRPHLPRAVRRRVRAGHHRSAGDDQEHRERDHRPRLCRRLGHAQPPTQRTGKTVAIVGSGPAGLAAAAQLNKVGPHGHRLRAGRPHRRPA